MAEGESQLPQAVCDFLMHTVGHLNHLTHTHKCSNEKDCDLRKILED